MDICLRLLCTLLLCTTTHGLQCDADHFANSTHCQQCLRCELGEQFYLRPCNGTHDALCGNCTVCAEDQFEANECDENRDTVCASCSVCTPGVSFALNACGPDSDVDRVCQNCTKCDRAIEPCTLTHDAVCGPTTTTPPFSTQGTILTLTLTSDTPVLTSAMLTSLGDALAEELNLPKTSVRILGVRPQRRLLSNRLTVDFLILTTLTPERVQSMNLAKVAKASGLPIVILSATASVQQSTTNTSVATTPPPPVTTTPPPLPKNDKTIVTTIIVVCTIIGLALLVTIVALSLRQPARVQDSDDFTDLEMISMTLVHEPIRMPRLSKTGGGS